MLIALHKFILNLVLKLLLQKLCISRQHLHTLEELIRWHLMILSWSRLMLRLEYRMMGGSHVWKILSRSAYHVLIVEILVRPLSMRYATVWISDFSWAIWIIWICKALLRYHALRCATFILRTWLRLYLWSIARTFDLLELANFYWRIHQVISLGFDRSWIGLRHIFRVSFCERCLRKSCWDATSKVVEKVLTSI